MNSRMIQILCINLKQFGHNEYLVAQLRIEAEAIRRTLSQVKENGFWDYNCEALHLDMEYIERSLEGI